MIGDIDSNAKQKIVKQVAAIVEEILETKVKVYEKPFIELGLRSVNVPVFIKRISEVFKFKVEVSSIFKYPTINEYAGYVENHKQGQLNEQAKEINYQGKAASYQKGQGSCEQSQGIDYLEHQKEEPVIVGMSCRFPGGGNTPEAYWEMLVKGMSGITTVPGSRWDVEKYYDEDKEAAGKMYTKKGGFLNIPINEFDAPFFNISPKEAKALDPQQRMLLELTWEAFESAGMDIRQYLGTNTGVYVAIAEEEYSFAHYRSGDFSKVNAYSLTGTTFSAACGRISYTFGFEGPCLSVDTACSSSLTALHLACKAIEEGEIETAVVAGVNLMVSPAIHVCFSKLGAISADGMSKSFDASANGYGRGEGAGVLILKSHRKAERDKDQVLAVIRGTGINQDGKSNGLTAPNGASQEKLIEQTLKRSKLRPNDVGYIEMHGTGTKLGDPIEVNAIANTYCKYRIKEKPLKIGSVKSNIGHLEAAAGMASLIKSILIFKNDLIPANLNFNNPNPFISWEEMPIEVVSENTPWEKGKRLRRIGINGFGFGGSNAHVILEEPNAEETVGVTAVTAEPKREEAVGAEVARVKIAGAEVSRIRRGELGETSQIKNMDTGSIKAENIGIGNGDTEKYEAKENIYILKISGKTKQSLLENIKRNMAYIKDHQELKLKDITYTNNINKSDFNYRFVVTGKTREELIEKMAAYLQEGHEAQITTNINEEMDFHEKPTLVFLFTGQGSQYLGMGKSLYIHNQVFRNAFEECDQLFREYLEVSLVALLYSEKYKVEEIDQTGYAQPLIFTIEYALSKFWNSIGVKPSIVLGHSIGEYGAAVIAGMMSLEDAVKLVAARGRLMNEAPGHGGMLAIYSNLNVVEELISDLKDKVAIAVYNAESNIVVSGEIGAIEEILHRAEDRKIKAKKLHVSHAFHSPMMNPILEEFKKIAEKVTYHTPQITFVSATLGRVVGEDEILDAQYWTRHISQKVDYYHALSQIGKMQNIVFLEVGANKTLCALARLILDEGTFINSLDMKKDAIESIAEALSKLYCKNLTLKWNALQLNIENEYKRVPLPVYAFDKKVYWIPPIYDHKASYGESYEGSAWESHKESYGASPKNSHQDKYEEISYQPLIGERISTPYLPNSVIYQRTFTKEAPYFMKEHIIFDTAIAPAAAHMSMLISIAKDYANPTSCTISDVEFHAPLIATGEERRLAQFVIKDTHLEEMGFELVSREKESKNEKWIEHCKGTLKMSQKEKSEKHISIQELQTLYPEVTDGVNVYDLMKKTGFKLGEGFTRIVKTWRNDKGGVCYLEPLCDRPEFDEYVVYAGVIDSIFQSVLSVSELSRKLNAEDEKYALKTTIPIAIKKLKYYYRPAKNYWCHVKVDNSQKEGALGDIDVYNEKGEIVFEVQGIMAKLTNRESLLKELNVTGNHMLYDVEWVSKNEREIERGFGLDEQIVIFGTNLEIINKLCERYRQSEIRPISVLNGETYEVQSDESYIVSYKNKEEISRVCEHIMKKHRAQKLRIIYVGISSENKGLTLSQLKQMEEMSCSCILNLIHAVTELNYGSRVSLKIIVNHVNNVGETNNADRSSDVDNTNSADRTSDVDNTNNDNKAGTTNKSSDIDISAATLWGFAKVISYEHSQLWKGIIDIDNEMLAQHMDEIIREINTEGDYEVALRGQERYVPQIIKAKINEVQEQRLEIKPSAAYLITGGTGAIGQIYAQYLIEQGAKNIVLLSKNGIKEGVRKDAKLGIKEYAKLGVRKDAKEGTKDKVKENITKWLEQGINVMVKQVDVAETEQVEHLVSELKESGLEIKGVIHTAGTIEDKMIKDQTWESFEHLFNTKVYGTYNLHCALKNEKLDFFIMMSSITAVVGNIGQANYAAANYFMNVFAGYRRSMGLPAMTICWGPWEGSGMATKSKDTLKNVEVKGIYGMPGETGKKIIDKLWHKDLVQIIVVDANWQLFSEKTGVESVTKLLANFKIENTDSSLYASADNDLLLYHKQGGSQVGNNENILEQLKTMSKEEKMDEVLALLRRIEAKVMGFNDVESVSLNQTFTEQGADSLIIFAMKNEVAKLFGVTVDVSTFYNYPSIRKLGGYLVEEYIR